MFYSIKKKICSHSEESLSHITMAISEWSDENLAEVIIIGGMVFCALSVGVNIAGCEGARANFDEFLFRS